MTTIQQAAGRHQQTVNDARQIRRDAYERLAAIEDVADNGQWRPLAACTCERSKANQAMNAAIQQADDEFAAALAGNLL